MRRNQLFNFFKKTLASILDGHPLDYHTFALAKEMPRHNVRMALHDRQDDLIAFLKIVYTPGVRDQINCFGSILVEIISLTSEAFRKRRVVSRASSYLCVAVFER